MSTKILPPRFAVLTTAGALLMCVFASGCQTKATTSTSTSTATSRDSKDGGTRITHPPGVVDNSKDGPVHHHRRHHRHSRNMDATAAPAPITHPGG